jgi:hypothetical protein
MQDMLRQVEAVKQHGLTCRTGPRPGLNQLGFRLTSTVVWSINSINC